MNEEDEKTVDNQAQAVGEESISPSKRQAYIDYARSKNGDSFDPDDEETLFSEMLDYRTKNDESQAKIVEMFSRNPQLAQIMSDMTNGKRGAAAAFARYFGRDFLSAEEGSDEWNEIEEAERERQAELDSMRNRKESYDANIESSLPVLEEFASEKKIDIDEFLNNVYSKLLEPIFMGTYTPEVLSMLYNALNYDTDVEDSFQSGKVAGRNEKIDKMRKANTGDGLPRLGASGGGGHLPKRPQKEKFKSSVWDD